MKSISNKLCQIQRNNSQTHSTKNQVLNKFKLLKFNRVKF